VRQIETKLITIATLLVLFSVGTATAMAQVDSIVGKYAGTAKSAGSPDAEIKLELTKAGDKITGQVMHGDTKIDVTEAA